MKIWELDKDKKYKDGNGCIVHFEDENWWCGGDEISTHLSAYEILEMELTEVKEPEKKKLYAYRFTGNMIIFRDCETINEKHERVPEYDIEFKEFLNE